MNIDELASYLRLEKQTIYNWLHMKKISGIKVGRVWRFEKDAVDRWLKSQTVRASEDFSNENKKNKRGLKGNINES